MQDKLWLSTISVGRELVLIPYGNFAGPMASERPSQEPSPRSARGISTSATTPSAA